MACCAFHDRLDKKLHTEEYIGMACGSLKNVRVVVPGGSLQGEVANVTGEQAKEYCCFNCPTLTKDKSSGLKPATVLPAVT